MTLLLRWREESGVMPKWLWREEGDEVIVTLTLKKSELATGEQVQFTVGMHGTGPWVGSGYPEVSDDTFERYRLSILETHGG